MKYNKKKAIQIIVNAAENYEKYLNNRQFLIIYQCGRKYEYVQIRFQSKNFLHLTGVKSELSAQRFYEACLCKKLGEKNIEIDRKGKVEQKLIVLPFLHELFFHNCMIGNFVNNGIVIRSDYFLGDTKAVLSLGFRYGKNIDIPVTLYREDVRKMVRPVNKVIAVFSKRHDEEEYSECTYLSKKHSTLQIELKEGCIEVYEKNV